MKPHRFPRLSAPLLAVLFLPACASVRERLTPRSAAVTRVIQQIDAYHGDRPPTPRELGASGPATIVSENRPPTNSFRIDARYRFEAVYPKAPPDAYSILVIDALIEGREPPPPPPPPKPVKGLGALDRRIVSCAVVTNSGRVIHRRDFSLFRP